MIILCVMFLKISYHKQNIVKKAAILNEDVLFLDKIVKSKVDVVIEHDMLYLVNNTQLILGKIRNIIKENGLFIRIEDKRDPNGIYNKLMINISLKDAKIRMYYHLCAMCH